MFHQEIGHGALGMGHGAWGMGHSCREQGALLQGAGGEGELKLPMPDDGRCSTWGDPKTALPPQCPMPHAHNFCVICLGIDEIYKI
jgi:hypothetical protein